MIALSNETQTMLYFPRIIKLNAVMCLNLIEELNVPNLKTVFKFYLKERCNYCTWIYNNY